MDLSYALRIPITPCLAFVGSGGKTTAMFRLARELSPPVLLTASTHMAVEHIGLADQHIVVESPADISALGEQISTEGVVLITGPDDGAERTFGLGDRTLEALRGLAVSRQLPLLVEADGSRQRPVKAPAEYEPPIPQFVDTVVLVIGLSGVGKPLTADWVHRPKRFAWLSGLVLGEQITPGALIRVLTHSQGGLKNIPSSARRVALLNQADALDDPQVVHSLAEGLLSEFRAVLISALGADPPGVWEVYEPVAGIILAAGAGQRFGLPKQTLLWQGKPLVWHVCQAAINAGLDPVVVVTGAYPEEVAAAVEALPVTCVYNAIWEQGQSTSVKAGLRALLPQVGGAVFLLADQPRVPPALIEELIRRHRQSLAPIMVPKVGQIRGNPVLFDQCTFADLLRLEGDVGGRVLFSRYPVTYSPWSDASVFLDVDTEEDYRKLRGLGGKS